MKLSFLRSDNQPSGPPGYNFNPSGGFCLGKIVSGLISFAIFVAIIYLIYKNPPWFQQLKLSIWNYFQP